MMTRTRKIAAFATVAIVLLAPALVDPVLMIGPLRKLALLLVAGWLGVVFLQWLDERLGRSFARNFAIIAESPLALATYLGARIVAVAMAIGLALGSIALVVAPRPAQAGVDPSANASTSMRGSARMLAAGAFPTAYDKPIRASCEEFLPHVPWLLCKAQWWQESRLDPRAVSPAGAAGLAQLMPGTAEDLRRALGYGALDRHSVEPALRAGSFYMARLTRSWSSPRPWWDRHALALASYNAGFGNILQAQARCGDPALYEPIMRCLPQVTGRHAAETLGYAPRIRRWWAMMEAGA